LKTNCIPWVAYDVSILGLKLYFGQVSFIAVI